MSRMRPLINNERGKPKPWALVIGDKLIIPCILAVWIGITLVGVPGWWDIGAYILGVFAGWALAVVLGVIAAVVMGIGWGLLLVVKAGVEAWR